MKKLLFIFLLISSFANAQIIKQKQVLGLQDSLTAIRNAGGGLGTLDTLPYPKFTVVQDNGGTSYKSHSTRVYNVKDYGAAGDGTTDDTKEIQDAINACNTGGGGIVYFPNGIYIIGDSLRTTSIAGNPNAQLYIPLNQYTGSTDLLKQIELLGESAPNSFADPSVSKAQPNTGVIIKSTLRHSGNIIGVSSEASGWGEFSFIKLMIKNIRVRALTDSSGVVVGNKSTAIDASRVAMFTAEDVVCDITSNLFNSVQPLSTSYGIKTPAINNWTVSSIRNFFIAGYYTAITVNEHNVIDGSNLIDACYIGLEYLTANHSSHVERLCIARTAYPITVSGVHPFNIDNISIEFKDNNLAPSGAWFNTITCLNETVVNSLGSIKYMIVQSGIGPNNALFNRSNATTSKILAAPLNKPIPSWTTATRPPTEFGIIGYNTNTELYEFYTSTGWKSTASIAVGSTTITGGATGSIPYNNAGIYSEDANQFVWDAANNRLGIGTNPPAYSIDILNNVNDYKLLNITNQNTGGNAAALLQSGNGTYNVNLGMVSTGYTTYGSLVANTASIYTGSPVGINLMADNATGVIKFSSGGNTERVRIDAAGSLNVGSGNFIVNSAGNITKLNNVTTTFPASNAAGVLTNDGSGTLTWAAAGGGSGITVGTTTITSGTNTRILYNNAGVVGEYLTTGSGTTVALSTSPTFTTSIITPVVTTASTELKLAQTGDAYGESGMYLRNRTGSAGGVFYNNALDLVDMAFLTSTASQFNFRYEHRFGQVLTANTAGEFQFMSNSGVDVNQRFGLVNSAIAGKTYFGSVSGIATESVDVLGNIKSSGFIELAEISAPATATATTARLYTKSDGLFYGKDDAGVETQLSNGLGGSATLDFASTGSGAVSDLTITVTGAALNDVVILGVPDGSVTATATYTAWVSAANTVKIRFSPKATEDPASGVFKVRVLQ